jgi:hypothetical protein
MVRKKAGSIRDVVWMTRKKHEALKCLTKLAMGLGTRSRFGIC